MPEITVISGKGGTGKTTILGAFAHLAENRIVCDLDVDAPDLHLLLRPTVETTREFLAGHRPRIDPGPCVDCRLCLNLCRFEAIRESEAGLIIDPVSCEGCKVCVHFCPTEAIFWEPKHCGHWHESRTRFGPMLHAQLFPGEENSGLLVSLLRGRAREIAKNAGPDLILSDGPPGIGCPVISSLTGTNLAVVVTEPTPSGRHDLERVVELCRHFKVPVTVLVNKCDLSPEQSQILTDWCREQGLDLAGALPFDPVYTEAMVAGRAVTEEASEKIVKQIKDIWEHILKLVEPSPKEQHT